MKRSIFFILICYSFELVAQNNTIDSLLIAKNKSPGPSRVNTFIELGNAYKFAGESEKSRQYSDSAIILSKILNYNKGLAYSLKIKGDYYLNIRDPATAQSNYIESIKILEDINDKKILGTVHNNLGISYMYESNYKDALSQYNIALRLNSEIGNKSQLANTYNNIGKSYLDLGNYPVSLDHFLKALKLKEELGEERATCQPLMNIGTLYLYTGKYKMALDNYEKALVTAKKFNSIKNIEDCYTSIGSAYFQMDNNKEALIHYTKALEINKTTGDKESLARLYQNIGAIKEEEKKYEEALDNYFKVIKISEENNWKIPVVAASVNIANIFRHQNKLNEAELYLKKGLKISESINYYEGYKECYHAYIRLDSARRNDKDAFLHQSLYYAYRDSLINKENTAKIVQTQMNYEFEKKEADIKAEQEKKEAVFKVQNKVKTLLLIGTILLFLFIIFIIGLVYRQNKLRTQQINIQLEQKLLRLQMNPHFIFNSLIAIESFIHTKQPDEAREYLADFAKLMRLILENSREETVSLQKEIDTLNHYLRLQKLTNEDSFTYQVIIGEGIDKEELKIPPMLIQPFIENAIKHGISDIEKGHVDVIFKEENEKLTIEILDNGVGILNQSSKSNHVSLATSITKERLNNLNLRKGKKISFNISDRSEGGTQVIFTLPYL